MKEFFVPKVLRKRYSGDQTLGRQRIRFESMNQSLNERATIWSRVMN